MSSVVAGAMIDGVEMGFSQIKSTSDIAVAVVAVVLQGVLTAIPTYGIWFQAIRPRLAERNVVGSDNEASRRQSLVIAVLVLLLSIAQASQNLYIPPDVSWSTETRS